MSLKEKLLNIEQVLQRSSEELLAFYRVDQIDCILSNKDLSVLERSKLHKLRWRLCRYRDAKEPLMKNYLLNKYSSDIIARYVR